MKPFFQTKRLSIRQLTKDDFILFHKMQSDVNVMKHVTGFAFSKEENEKDLNNVISCYSKKENNFWVWAIDFENRFIGTCAIVENEKQEWEIGYRFLPAFWQKGFGTEAAKALIEIAFTKMNIQTLVAYADKENVATVRILDRLFNFVKEEWNEKDQCIDRIYKLSS
ncbi:GNAT family N-acetyltransferase [Spongiivirga citrea]|uniref:GNAT family N-acetyltransferase n=1 Tax=Spongiivirga citrea TaxID=1481457 RepID=A0A6M0CIK1_9FLAO|nr:GNAT family N-acetyltransferase [Spongiivirga citrea]NER17711.1 GNAT family N-acetyltransferase [Spongiivirga citrea]